MPISRPANKFQLHQKIAPHLPILPHALNTLIVPCPARPSDTDICLLKYVFGFALVRNGAFSRESFDRDGHEKAIADNEICSFDADDLIRLWLDVVRLMCGVTEKFHSVRNLQKSKQQRKRCGLQCRDACCTDGRIFYQVLVVTTTPELQPVMIPVRSQYPVITHWPHLPQ